MKPFLLTCICFILGLGTSLCAEDAPKPNDLFGPDAHKATDAPPIDRQKMQRPERPDQQGPKRPDGKGPGPSAEDLQAIFDKLDSDANGSISPEEFSKLMEAQKAFAEEKRAQHEADMLEKYDSDGDGSLNEDEKKTAAKAMHTERMMKHLESLKEKNPEKFAELDTNSDGKIDEAEVADMQAAQLAKFNERAKQNPQMMAKLDKNQDGTIDAEEMQEMRKMRKQMGGDRPQKQKGERKQRKKE